ncbi:AT-rich interactive domain-containing protein 3A isoform X2 [Eurytemora carolleeae]|uniref:AT-rich interactive domain-containing protein 3A isoform X2 n=1 Tax=Eurytemora carolleeae TaxID=1294199 RepID=UPI000C794DFD|nr:AT-rich interactive domain-containing protein 3A isoform X2 [Eurytemora carolleeae]|eukprot:XP_023349146.1 AT-rich interactive domain-containing protein 3A-like isoform X2 [Eurytemora affinis]
MLYPEKTILNMMESALAETMGVRSAGGVGQDVHNKSQLDNIVGSLWQARQESSGSSLGNQSPRNGEDMISDPGSPNDSGHDNSHKQDREDDQELASDLRLPRDYPFSFPGFGGIPSLPTLEALNKQKELLGSNIILPVSSPQGLLKTPSSMFPHHGFPPLRPPSQPTSQSNSPSDFGTQQNWSFEEQFKQVVEARGTPSNISENLQPPLQHLYEIDENPKRKDFLDELFAFMQKRGTPINRLPIMAKQVLDLYELYNLVVARGGLVEVINKKQWQEIIKGLGLPSSITSAAFTLRTQYTKYLYPLECKLNNLSNPNDLQSAIEGNKREGRTSSYGPYGMGLPFQNSPLPPSMGSMPPFSMMNTPPRSLHMNGNGRPMHPGSRSPPGLPTGPQDPLSAFEMTRLALLKMYNQSGMGGEQLRSPLSMPNLPLPPDLPGMHMQEKALNLQVERERQERENFRHHEREKREHREMEERERNMRREIEMKRERLGEERMEKVVRIDREDEGVSPPPSKRMHHDEDEDEDEAESPTPLITVAAAATNIKITSRGEGNESSLVVCMELNGQTYQGILFQKPI